jgi:hypothetical protein
MSQDPMDTDTQRRVATLVSSIDLAAPPALHESVGELIAAAERRGRRGSSRWSDLQWIRRPAPLLAGAGALAIVAALVLALTLGSGSQTAPTVLQVSALSGRPATLAAPDEDPHNPGHLAIAVDGLAYPYWGQQGWQTAGARTDTMDGRRVTTVFYARPARKHTLIGYSIVAGRTLAIPTGGRTITWHGVRYEVLPASNSTVMTWRRDGHTCILVGSGVSAHSMLTLAGWQAS